MWRLLVIVAVVLCQEVCSGDEPQQPNVERREAPTTIVKKTERVHILEVDARTQDGSIPFLVVTEKSDGKWSAVHQIKCQPGCWRSFEIADYNPEKHRSAKKLLEKVEEKPKKVTCVLMEEYHLRRAGLTEDEQQIRGEICRHYHVLIIDTTTGDRVAASGSTERNEYLFKRKGGRLLPPLPPPPQVTMR